MDGAAADRINPNQAWESVERILVSIDMRGACLGALYRAIHLAARIKASVDVLLVSNHSPCAPHEEILPEMERSFKNGLELLIERGKSDGVKVNHYVACGDYEEEVIRFVRDRRITLLVLDQPESPPGAADSLREFERSVSRIRRRVDCSIELVQRKETAGETPGAEFIPHGQSEAQPAGDFRRNPPNALPHEPCRPKPPFKEDE